MQLLSAILGTLGLLFPSVTTAAPTQVTSESPAPPLSIDGAPIPWDEFAGWLVLLQGRTNAEDFVVEYLLEREAEASGVLVRDADLLATIDENIQRRVDGAFEGDRSLWLAEMERLGQTPETYRAEQLSIARRTLRTDLLVQERRVLTDEEVKALWEDRYGPSGRRMRMSLLFLKITPPPQEPGTTRDENIRRNEEAKEQTFEQARVLLANFRESGNFEELVRLYSQDEASRERGGRLEEPFSFTRWPNAPAEEVRAMKLGSIVGPFYGDGGVCLMRLDSEEVTPFEDVSSELRQLLREAAADQVESQTLWNELRAEAQVELLPELSRPTSVDDPRRERPVLAIDDQAVTRGRFARWLMARRGRPLIRTFIQHREVSKRAAAAGIDISAIQVEERVQTDLANQIQAFHKGDRDAWLAELTANGKTVEDFMHVARLRTAHNLRAEALILKARVVSEDDLRREWEERYGEGGQSLDLRYILRRIPAPAEGTVTTEEEIQEYKDAQTREILSTLSALRERAHNGEDFAALARTYSEEAESRDRGGRPLERVRLYTWPENIQAVIRALSPGEVAAPIDFGGGTFLLVELAGRVLVPFADVEAELRKELEARRPSQVEISSQVNEWTKDMVVLPLPGMYR